MGIANRAGLGQTVEFNRRATATTQILAGILPNPTDPALKRFIGERRF